MIHEDLNYPVVLKDELQTNNESKNDKKWQDVTTKLGIILFFYIFHNCAPQKSSSGDPWEETHQMRARCWCFFNWRRLHAALTGIYSRQQSAEFQKSGRWQWMFSGREGRLWGACVPLAQALPCCVVWKPDVGSSRAVCDRVAAGQTRKCLWPRSLPPPPPSGARALLSGRTESHETGDTLRHRSAGRGWPEDPTLTNRLGLRWQERWN